MSKTSSNFVAPEAHLSILVLRVTGFFYSFESSSLLAVPVIFVGEYLVCGAYAQYSTVHVSEIHLVSMGGIIFLMAGMIFGFT